MTRKNKPRVIPDQDKKICGSICLCQLTIVLSCVSIVYLSVAVYVPSFEAFKSGFEADPVMCQTIDLTLAKDCPWASCGEWCLTKSSGSCNQIHATVRRNGTDIILYNCSRINATPCDEVYPDKIEITNCNMKPCLNLNGTYNCTTGLCRNMSEKFQCYYQADGPIISTDKDKLKLSGFFDCLGRKCTKITKPFTCDRNCNKITTSGINVLLMEGNSLHTANCQHGMALKEARGAEPGIDIEPTQFWDENMGILLTTCMTVNRENDKFFAYDCINGTLLNDTTLPQKFMLFPQFWKIVEQSKVFLDPTQRFLPKQSALTIYNSSRLYINLEGCVNTLRDECSMFIDSYGKDGDNNTAQSQFLCYYNKNDSLRVVARFDLDKTYRELLIASIVPTILFIISFTSLCIITRSVKVGDDARMRCQYCAGDNSDLDDNLIRSGSKTECPLAHRPMLSDDELPELKIDPAPPYPDDELEDTEKPGGSKNVSDEKPLVLI